MNELTDKIRKTAKCVFLACEAAVAEDISATLKEAATRIEAQDEEIKQLKKDLRMARS